MKIRIAVLQIACLLAAGCGNQSTSSPWLTMPNASFHAAHFPIAAGDTHGPPPGATQAECNKCHYDKAATPPGPSASFTVYTCTNCHVLLKNGLYHDDPQATLSTWHATAGVNQFDSTVAAANVAGVAKIDAACRACHPTGLAVDHATRFLLPHQDVAGTTVATCADCHVDPADRKVLGCAQCHPHDLPATATGHAKVPDFQATDSTLCARCHEDGKTPVTVAAHATGAGGFVVGSGSHAGTAGGACLTCHPQNRTTAPRTFVADFKASTCVACHVAVGGGAFHDDATSLGTLHTQVTDYTSKVSALGLSAACLSCHADGAGGAPSNHEQLFPRGAGTKHAGIACGACHTNPANRADLAALACASCHASLTTPPTLTAAHAITGYTITSYRTATTAGGTTTTVQISMTDSRSCLKCHADSQVDRVASHDRGNSGFGQGEHRTAGCLTCHSRLRTDKAWGTNFDEARGAAGPPPTGCYVCHRTGSGN